MCNIMFSLSSTSHDLSIFFPLKHVHLLQQRMFLLYSNAHTCLLLEIPLIVLRNLIWILITFQIHMFAYTYGTHRLYLARSLLRSTCIVCGGNSRSVLRTECQSRRYI